jgi:hypothetical protein
MPRALGEAQREEPWVDRGYETTPRANRRAGLRAVDDESLRRQPRVNARGPASRPYDDRAGMGHGTAGVSGRRTVTIRGQAARPVQRRRPTRSPYERAGSRPDRVAMWAVLLGVLLILVAATSSHAAMHRVAHPLRPAAAVTRAHARADRSFR